MGRFIQLLVLLAMVPLRAAAQDTSASDEGLHVSPAVGVHYGTPLRFSVAAGVLVDRNAKGNDGLIVMLEPGQHGNEASAGYFRMLGHFGSGYSLRAAVLRTGDEPWNSTPHTTYVGVEAHWMIVFGVGGHLGYLRRASHSGATDQRDNLATVGVSIGG